MRGAIRFAKRLRGAVRTAKAEFSAMRGGAIRIAKDGGDERPGAEDEAL